MNRIVIHVFLWLGYLALAIAFKINNLGSWYAVKHSLVMLPVQIFSYYGFGYLAVNRFLEKKMYKAFALVTVIFFYVLYMFMINFIVPDFEQYYRSIPGSHIYREQRVVTITIILAMSVSTLFHMLENRIIKEQKTQLLLNQHNKAKLMYLKAQINPHFLFNALNNIYSLSVIKSEKTPKMVLNLSDLLRYSIYEGQKEKVMLTDEILHIKKYLELYQASQEKEVDIKLSISGNRGSEKIEPMMLIPLVENCIKHGDFATNPEAFVKVTLEVVNNSLRFSTVNSTTKTDLQKDTVGGVGLSNIKNRLTLKYPNDHTFHVVDKEKEFEVFLNIRKLENT